LEQRKLDLAKALLSGAKEKEQLEAALRKAEQEQVDAVDEVGAPMRPADGGAGRSGGGGGAAPDVAINVGSDNTGTKNAALVGRAAFREDKEVETVEKITILVGFMAWALEVVSACDLFTDVLILYKIYSHHHVWWCTLTLVMMLSPYWVSYAAAMSLMLRNQVFEIEDQYARTRTVMGFLFMTPLCVAYFLLIDVLYAVRAVTFDLLVMVTLFLSCGRINLASKGDSAVDKFCSGVLGLSIMDIEGYRRMRTMSQLIFESAPQLVLQARILLHPIFAQQIGLTTPQLVSSMFFAGFHSLVSCCILWMEAGACRDSMVHYAVVCLSGRFGWVPFVDRLASERAKSALGTDKKPAVKAESLPFASMRYDLPCGRFSVEYQFSRETINVMLERLSQLDAVDEDSQPVLELGKSCDLLELEDVLRVVVAMQGKAKVVCSPEKAEMNMDAVVARSPEIRPGREEEAHAMLCQFVSYSQPAIVKALLKVGVPPDGLTATDELLLTVAAKQRNAELCEMLLDSEAPLVPDEKGKGKDTVVTDFNGGIRSTMVLPLAAALDSQHLPVIEVFATHPRVRLDAGAKDNLMKRALAACEQEDLLSGARWVFAAGGLAAKNGPDLQGNSKTFEQLARGQLCRPALAWVLEVQGQVPRAVTVTISGSSEDFAPGDLERFMLLRDKLTDPETRLPLGHPPTGHLPFWVGAAELDLSPIAAKMPQLQLSTLQHLVALTKPGAPAPAASVVPTLDLLAEALGLDRGYGYYMRNTVDCRTKKSLTVKQEKPVHCRHNDPEKDRGLTVLRSVLPADCHRISRIELGGRWEDQGWGGSNANTLTLFANTQHSGQLRHAIHWVNHDLKGQEYPDAKVILDVKEGIKGGKRFEESGSDRVGNIFLEALSGGDELWLTASCVGWGGWEAKVSNTVLQLEYCVKG